MIFATMGYVLLPSAAVWANPTGEQVVGGAATFDRQGNTLTVNQATDRLAVNWQDFSIAAGETTHFNMPSAASIALNRVLGGNPSQIYGTLSSNGNIILVNNAGIFVGPGGVVNAASFVGSTLDIDPGQFMNAGQGGYHLHGDSYAPIVNQGNITAEKGDVFLIAQKVENRGTISAPKGTAAMVGTGAKTEVVLHEVGGSGFAVRVAQLQGEDATGSNHNLPDGEELLNEGEIAAAQAELNASGNIYALAIKNTGTIRAKAVVAQADGTVRLDGGFGDVKNAGTLIANNAGDEATAAGGKIEVTGRNVTASPESIITAAGGNQGGNGGKVKIDSADTTFVQGKVDVTAPSANAKGGKVELLGEKVGLMDGTKVDASGGTGGGTVLAGGDYLGGQTPKAELKDLAKQEAEPVKNSKATVMASTAEIKADATVNGDGGKIILWSDEYTGFYGQLFARGGAEGGNGGFIETSSKDNLQAFGSALASAAKGQGGLWLLDPYNVAIVAGAADTGGTFNANNPNQFTPTADSAQIGADNIVASLNNGVSVTVTTSGAGTQPGNITVSSAISKTAGNSATLRLVADNDITTAAGITSTTGNLAVEMVAGANGSITLGDFAITTNGGYVSLSAGAGIILNNQAVLTSVRTAGGAFTANADSNADGVGKFTITRNAAVTLVDTSAGVNPAGSITITSAEIAIGGATGGSINAGGANIQLINSVAANSMNVATLPIGPYDISQTTLNNISTTGLLVIGGANQTGAIRVGSPDFVTGGNYGIQFGANAATPISLANDILTAGKVLNFFGAVTLSPNAGVSTGITLNTAAGGVTAGADILFLGASTLNSDALGNGQPRALTVNAGTLGRLFLPINNGNIAGLGGITPLGSLDLTAGGGILLQGATAITTLKAGQGSPTGDVLFKSSILPTVSGTGTRTLAITTQNGGNVSFQAVGTSANPMDGLTVSSGTGTTTLNSNIFTAGGAVDLGSAVTLSTGAITIDTTRLGRTGGAGISFRQTLGGARGLTLYAGTSGALLFGGAVSTLTSFTVASGASFTVDNGSTFDIAGNISIDPQVVTNGNNIRMTTTVAGTITLNAGLITNPAGSFGRGGDVTLNAAGALTIKGELNASGLSGTFVIPGPPSVTVATTGFDGGKITLTGASITTDAILANGDRDQTGNSRGGNGGSITLTSAGAKSVGSISLQGALGSPAGAGGELTFAGFGDNILKGIVILDGGSGQAAGDSGARAGSLILNGGGAVTTLNSGISANGGNGNGSAGGGSAGSITFPTLKIGGANVAITAVGGNNGTAGTGRGTDGVLTFSSLVDGATLGANSLEIDVDAGTVTFQSPVGGAIRMGQITVQNARNVSFNSSLTAEKFVQNASVPLGGIFTTANQDGTTTFGGTVTLNATGTALDLTGYNFTFKSGLAASNGSINGVINGVFTANNGAAPPDPSLRLGGDMTLARGVVAGINPRVDLAVNVTTSSGALIFGTVANPLNVRLLDGDITLTAGSGGGQISFGGLVDSGAIARNLILNTRGTVTFNGLVGSLNPLSNLTTDEGGSLVLAAAGTRASPSINVSGTLTLNDQVDLQAATVLKANALTLTTTGLMDGANDLLVLLNTGNFTLNGQVGQATPLASLRVEGATGAGTRFGFAGTLANPSVNTTGNQYYGPAVTLLANTVLNAGNLDFLSTINGDKSLLLDSAGAINLYGRVGNTGTELTQFQTSGGGILNLLATGANGDSPTIKTSGAQLFGSSLVLGEDTFLTSTTSGDFIFLNAIDSRLANQPRSLTVDGKGKVVLEAAAGGGTRLRSASLKASGGSGDVTVNAGINTFGGNISLESVGGSVVLGGNTDSGVADQLGGAITLKADTQVLLNGGSITTFGGAVTFNQAANGTTFIQTATTITTTGGTSDGAITFNKALNGLAGLTLAAGRGALTFDAIGTTNPLGLNVNSSGNVTLRGDVVMGGNFLFNNLSGNFVTNVGATPPALFTINSAVDAAGNPYGLSINPVSSSSTVALGAIGTTSPLGAVIVGSGGSSVTLNGNIFTAGGGVSLGSPTTLASNLTVDTTRLGRAGGGVTFLGSVDTDVTGANVLDISITAGTGAVSFAGAVGATRKPRDLIVNSGGSISLTDVANLNVARDILVIPQASSVNDMTLTAGRNIEFRQGITARPNNGPGRNLTVTANNGSLTIGGSVNVGGRSGTFIGFAPDGSSFTFATAGAKGGKVTLSAQSISTGAINANGSDNFVTGGNGGDGGSVVLTSKNDLITGPINVSGGTDGDLGGAGGSITLVRSEATGTVRVGTLSSAGGASNQGVGAAGGAITISATLGDLVAPTDFLTQGGAGSAGFTAGQGGTVTLRADVGSLSFANSSLTLAGDGGLAISAGRHLILATVADVTTPSLSTGGVVFTLNSGAPRLDRRGAVGFEYGSANNGGTFFMPASSYVVSNGGDIRVDVRDIALGSAAGAMTISGFSTSGDNVNGGRILLNNNPGAGGLGAVTVLGSLETLGGTPTTPTYGRAGGSVFIAGTTVSVGSINTAGSGSLATATTPAFGGSGGDIEIRGDAGITLRRNLVTTGGTGLGVGDANGGGGGGISLKGDVTLNSGDSQNTIIILNTQGGGLAAQGSYGLGGSITATGKITGTTSTSNTLDLRYGSGTATLGDAAADTITLGTLITAADDARSTGSLVINGKLVVDNMITYARGYSLSIFGDGTQFSSFYTFLNTGTVGLGAAGAGVTFVGGFNSTAGAATRLNGIVNTGSAQSLDNGGNMAMGAVILAADSTLNSNGNNITLTTIDNDPSVSGAKDLTFASGVGSTGIVTISGAVGSLNAVDVVRVSSAGPVTFGSSFNGGAIVTDAGTTTTFRGGTSVTGPLNGITTTGASSLGGTVTLLNSLYASDRTQVFTLTSSTGTFDMPGTVTMSGGPFALAGAGTFTVPGGGTLTGSQTLTLSGAGVKTFSGTLTAGNGTTAITATGGPVTFGGIATLSGASSFAMAPTLTGGTITASGLTTMSIGLNLGGAGTLGGAGSYQINGDISGAGQRLTLSGAGQKTITGNTAVAGMTQTAGSGQVFFGNLVTTTSTSDFYSAVILNGITFNAGGATTFNTLGLQGGNVILDGNVAYTVSGAVTGNADGTRRNLTLNGTQAKTFNGALSGIETLAIGGGSLVSSGGLEANTLTQNGNAMTLGGSVNVANALNLDGATSLNSGTTLTAASGLNISAGSFASNGNARLAGGTVTIGIGTLTSNAGTLTVAPGLQMGTANITLAGPGNYAFLGNLSSNGADRNLTLNGGSTSFSGTLTGVSSLTGNGAVTFGNNVTTSGSVAMNGVTATSANVTISSGGNNQTFARAVTLGGNLASQTTGTTSFGGGVSGGGNLSVNGANFVDIGAGIENRGTFLLTRAGAINLGLGDLNATEVGFIRSSGGATFEATGGSSVDASGVTANTGMTLRSTTGSASASSVLANAGLTVDGATGATVAGTTVNGGLNLATLGVANFNPSLSSARSLGIQAASISSGGQAGVLANISVPSLAGITLTGGGLDYRPSGNLTTTGQINTSGNVVLAPSENFINGYAGNPFTAPSTRILTRDFFSFPNSAGVPGLVVSFGVTSLSQLGANQIGVALPLLAGSGGPYITEFTTGTGQPYILATQNAVPGVMMPVALPTTGAFGSRVTYTQDDLEMMTPQERSAFEADRRQQAARVLLQRSGEQEQEIGVPTEGEIPQAKAPEPGQPSPTAQVILGGKPLAAKADKEKGDSTQLLRARSSKAVALRPEMDSQKILENERLAAEVNLEAAPVAIR